MPLSIDIMDFVKSDEIDDALVLTQLRCADELARATGHGRKKTRHAA